MHKSNETIKKIKIFQNAKWQNNPFYRNILNDKHIKNKNNRQKEVEIIG